MIAAQTFNSIKTAIPASIVQVGSKMFSSPIMVASSFLALPITEMGVRTVIDIYQACIATEKNAKQTAFDNLQANLGGVVFYGLTATNLIPYLPFVGVGCFVIHSISKNISHDNPNDYYLSRTIGWTARHIFSDIVKPICTEILFPMIERISNVFIKTIRFIANLVGAIFKNAHPVWKGTAILLAAVVCYHGALAAMCVAKGTFFAKAATVAVV